MDFKEIVGQRGKSKIVDVDGFGKIEVRGVSVAVWNKAKILSKPDCVPEQMARVIVQSCYDLEGKKIFEGKDEDHDWLVLKCPTHIYQQLSEAVNEVNLQEDTKVNKEAKNSETAQESDSSSS